MKTIGIDASRANRKEKTGIEWYAYHLLNEMKRITDQNNRFLLYTDEPLRDALRNLPNGWEEKILSWPPRKFWTQGRLSLEMLFRAPDLLFIPSHVIPTIHAKQVVLTCHDIGFERRPELYPDWERRYHQWSMRFAIKHATHIIAVSEFTKQELMDVYGIPEERITVIHHGYYGGGLALSSASRSARRDAPYFLSVGRIEAKKNLTTIIDAFTQLKTQKRIPEEYQLILVGRPGFQSDAIFRYANHSPVAKDIHFSPWIPADELQELYTHASLYLFPSLYEGFGLPLLEAFSFDIPVIASDIPALREIGERGALYAQPTANAFAEAIEKLLRDPLLQETLKKEGKIRLSHFSWQKTAEKTLTVLKNTVS